VQAQAETLRVEAILLFCWNSHRTYMSANWLSQGGDDVRDWLKAVCPVLRVEDAPNLLVFNIARVREQVAA
jgi:hypothetical protein